MKNANKTSFQLDLKNKYFYKVNLKTISNMVLNIEFCYQDKFDLTFNCTGPIGGNGTGFMTNFNTSIYDKNVTKLRIIGIAPYTGWYNDMIKFIITDI